MGHATYIQRRNCLYFFCDSLLPAGILRESFAGGFLHAEFELSAAETGSLTLSEDSTHGDRTGTGNGRDKPRHC